MKTIQTFALLILLFTANTFCHEGVVLEKDEGSLAIETKVPEDLIAILDGKAGLEGGELESETYSSILTSQEPPTEDIEVNSTNNPQTEDEVPEIIESSSIVSLLESSTKSPEEKPQIIEQGASLSESEVEVQASNSPNNPQTDEEISATIPNILESSSNQVPKLELPTERPEGTPQIVDKGPTLSESGPAVQELHPSERPQKEEEIPVSIPEAQESSSLVSESETSTEKPEETTKTVDEETTLRESDPEVQAEPEKTSEHQQPLDTIVCVCNCGINSNLPQKCEEEVVLENENIPSTESTKNPLDHPEIEKEAEDDKTGNIETEASLDLGDTSSSTLEAEDSKVSEKSTEPIITETETVATQEIDSSEAPPITNAPHEEAGLIVDNESTTVIDEIGSVTEHESKSSPPTESTEASEPEPITTNNPLEVTSTTINPCTEMGDFPDPTNCRQFLSCSSNGTSLVSQELQCPERSAFNSLLRRCTRDLSPCLDEEPTCLKTGSLPNPNGENSSYFWCVPNLLGGFHKYHIKCSQNEIFMPLLGRCWPEMPPQLGLGFGLINREPSDRDLVRAEWKILKREIKLKIKEDKLRKKMEEKAKARAEKLLAKELKRVVRKVDDDDDDDGDGKEASDDD